MRASIFMVFILHLASILIGAASYPLVRAQGPGGRPLDPTFDRGRKAAAHVSLADSQANALAIQDDGKIVVVGGTGSRNSLGAFALARFNGDGSLDPAFDRDGMATTSFPGTVGHATAVAIQDDGKIVVVGFLHDRDSEDFRSSIPAMARFDPDGSLDTTFDGDGWVFPGGGDCSRANALAIQTDGKIAVAGSDVWCHVPMHRVALTRFNSDGSIDPTFINGVRQNFDTSFGSPHAVALQPDGKIVVAGAGCCGTGFAAARFNADGSVDNNFDDDGLVTADFPGDEAANALAIQSNDRIVVAGFAGRYPDIDFALARWNPDGTPDTTFDGDGRLTTTITAENDRVFALAVQQDGKLVAAGATAE